MERVNQWLTLAANVGILVSILFLATQIEQNSQMMQVQALTTNAATHAQIDVAALGENPVPATTKYFNGARDLSDEELVVVTGWLSANSWQFRNSFKLYEMGIISEADWQSELAVLVGYYGTPIGRSYWKASKQFYPPAYIRSVESALSSQAQSGMTWFETIRDGVEVMPETP